MEGRKGSHRIVRQRKVGKKRENFILVMVEGLYVISLSKRGGGGGYPKAV